jgi:colicin import membrane protein
VRKESASKQAAEKAAADKAATQKEKAAKAAQEKAAKAQAEKAAVAKAQQAREASLQQQLQNELKQSQSKGILDAYGAAIKAKVTAQWYKPPGWQPQWTCNVRISQASDGTVLNVKILQCGGDQLFQRSVQQAIERASPLPLPSDMSLFSPSINFTFTANSQP